MYGTSHTGDDPVLDRIRTVADRVTLERVLDALLETDETRTVADLGRATGVPTDDLRTHLDVLESAGVATETDTVGAAGETTGFHADPDALPLEDLVQRVPDERDDAGPSAARAEVFLLEDRDKEYRQRFGVDDPYDVTDTRFASRTDRSLVAALDQWFGVRKRLHQRADEAVLASED